MVRVSGYSIGMKRLTLSLIIACMVSGVSPAFAQTPETPGWSEAVSGDYDAAIKFGAEAETADGYVIAASALVAKILTLKSDDIKGDAKDARDYAEDALKLDPDNPEALLQYAVAYGIVARASSDFTAWRKKMPQKSLKAIRAAQAANPQDARADALLGSWHTGVVRKAGVKRAADMFGAEEALGIAAFEKAAARAPEDITVNMNYVLSALALDPIKYGDRAKQTLERLSGRTAGSDIERVYLGWAENILEIYDDKDVLQKRAVYYVDGE